MARSLLLAPLLLTGCFDLDVDVELKRNGASGLSFGFDVQPDTVALLKSFAPSVIDQLREQLATAGTQLVPDDDAGRAKVTRHKGKDALGMTTSVAYPPPRDGGDALPPGALTLVDLGDGLWELSFGDDAPAEDDGDGEDELAGLVAMLGSLGGTSEGAGFAAALGALPPITLSASITVPGPIVSVEPPDGEIAGSTATWTLSFPITDTASAERIGTRRAVRFRAGRGVRFPEALVAR